MNSTEMKDERNSQNYQSKQASGEPKIRRNVWLKYVLLVVLCAALGLIDSYRSFVSSYYNGVFYARFWDCVRWDLTGWMIWTAFIPLVFRLARRFPLERRNWRVGLTIFLPVGLLIAAARTLFPALVYLIFDNGWRIFLTWFPERFYYLITDSVIAFVFYAFVLAFGQATNYYKRYREEEVRRLLLESQLSKAQLEALKMQLHPHFLFNALNSISALQMENVEAAQEMIARLGDFLRMTLQNVGAQMVTLGEEIEFTHCYLDIEKVRFGRRLTTGIEVAPDVLHFPVPNLILQPLVENAIRHGLSKQLLTGRISIRAVREHGWLKIEISDNGEGIENSNLGKVLSSGIGLSNTKARLEQLYGANFRFELQNAEEGGLLAILHLPHNRKPDKEILTD